MGGLGLTCARDIAPAAYATSLLTAQDLKLRILGRTEQYSPANIKPALITYLGAKMGEEVTTDSLTGVTRKPSFSLTINLHKSQLLTNQIDGLGNVCEGEGQADFSGPGLPHAGDWLNVLPSPIYTGPPHETCRVRDCCQVQAMGTSLL